MAQMIKAREIGFPPRTPSGVDNVMKWQRGRSVAEQQPVDGPSQAAHRGWPTTLRRPRLLSGSIHRAARSSAGSSPAPNHRQLHCSVDAPRAVTGYAMLRSFTGSLRVLANSRVP